MGPLVSRLSAFLSSMSHNSVNVCSILKIRCRNLSQTFSCQTKHDLFIYLLSELNNTCIKLCNFFGTPGILYKNSKF